MLIKKFGMTKAGREVDCYILKNNYGMTAEIINFGAAVVSLKVPDRDGNLRDVVLGYDSASQYEENPGCFGAVIGRNANRIANAEIEIDGFKYTLDNNNNGNNIHSGVNGFNKSIWSASYCDRDDHKVTFCYESKEGTQGFPGNLYVRVTYEITENNSFIIHYEAETDRKTVVNMTNHSYFNLNGHNFGSVMDHSLYMEANEYTPIVKERKTPTGEIVPVKDTPMDFTTMKKIGRDIDSDYEQLKFAGGYDHNYVLRNNGKLKQAAILQSDESGIGMEVYTDRPAVQLYTGNFIADLNGKNGAFYGKRSGVCLETQGFIDALHHNNFPTTLLEPKDKFDSTTRFDFFVVR